MKRVVIVGVGFGGLETARNLAGHGLDVVVLDRRNFHLFQPLLYQVATAMLDQETIAHSIRAMVRNWKNVHFRMAEVQSIDLAGKRVLTADEPIAYDYLVVAAGSVTNFFGNDVLQQHALDLKQLHDAVALRNHILSVYERASVEADPKVRESLLTFVIVGGGPTGVEFAGSLSELTHHVLDKDFPELKSQRSRIILVESGKEVLSMFPRKLQHYALRRLERMGVEVRLNSRVTSAQADRVFFQDGSEIPAHTLFWGAGVRAAPLAETLSVPKVRGGRIPVEPDLRLKEHPEVFVIGDLAYLEQDGAPLPMVAPVAIQQGQYAADKSRL
jgi:NADH dehydrogenase